MLTTIVFFFALLLNIIVIAKIFNDLVDGVNDKDFYITPLFILIALFIIVMVILVISSNK